MMKSVTKSWKIYRRLFEVLGKFTAIKNFSKRWDVPSSHKAIMALIENSDLSSPEGRERWIVDSLASRQEPPGLPPALLTHLQIV